jgi:D,D-heptose 1,7-bisphosphate phosphatase
LNRVVFLDRDGVINKHREDYVKSVRELKILKGIFSSIRKLNQAGFKIIVISNQSAINRKKTTRKKVEEIHQCILNQCRKNHCNIDGFYYCPHTPEENCSCRKPRAGLQLNAAKEHELNLKSSWMIGDNITDIMAGKAAGCKTIKIKTNGSINSAVKKIINQDKNLPVLILAGGLGTRLGYITKKTPKPIIRIKNKPFLQYQIELLKRNNLRDCILSVGYLSEKIIKFFGNGKKFGINILYSVEEEQLGTGGAIKKAISKVNNDFIVMNGDTFLEVNFYDVIKFHEKNNADLTMVLTHVKDASRYTKILLNKKFRIKQMMEDSESKGFINAGVYIINKKAIDWKKLSNKFSLEKDLLPNLIKTKKVFGYIYRGYFIDIGIPTSLKKFKTDSDLL